MAQMKIDQVGLSAGLPGVARKDGKSDGSEVTLTDMTAGGTTLFEILWVDPSDTHALSSLLPTADPHVWKFTPSSGVKGPIRIRLTHTTPGGVITTQTRIFGIPDTNGNVPPAPGERSDPNAARGHETDAAVIDRCERNWPTTAFPAGNPYGWGLDLPRATSSGGDDATKYAATTTFTAVKDTAYVCTGVSTVTLPDAATCAGAKITLSFGDYGNVVQNVGAFVGGGEGPHLAPNYFYEQGGSLNPYPLTLPAGTYVFQSIYDPTTVAIAIWVLQRHAGSFGRRSIDVDYCMGAPMPGAYERVTIPNSTRYYVRPTGDATDPLPFDDNGDQPAHKTVFIPFDSDLSGVYRVNKNNGPTDWELELLEDLPSSSNNLGEASETEYRIRFGQVWGNRRFLSNSFGNNYLPPVILVPQALGMYPPDGAALDGNAGEQNYVFPNDSFVCGKVNLFEAGADGALTLRTPDPSRIVGERFAIKAVGGAGASYTITVADGSTIEGLDGLISQTCAVDLSRNSYVEWTLTPDQSGNPIWRVVASYAGTPLG